MRILQINKFMDPLTPAAGGPATFMSLTARRLGEAGCEMLRFGCRMGAEPRQWPPYVDYTSLPSAWEKLRGAARICHSFPAAEALDRFLTGRRVDVAHIHNIYHHLTPSILPVLRRRGIPIVMSVRDYRLLCPARSFLRGGRVCTECHPHRYFNCLRHGCGGSLAASAALAAETFVQRFFRRYIRNVALFLCPSRFLADKLLEDGYPAGKVRVLRNPIVPPDVSAAPQRSDLLLCVGRLSEEKGLDLVLEAASARPGVRVRLVGDGPQRHWLQAEASRRGLANVEFTGYVPHERIDRHYAEATAVVLASRCFENSPHSLLEGMAAGRCVVAPGHGPIGEWVTDGETGRTFRPGDAADLTRVTDEVLADPAVRDRMGRAGAALVRRRHEPGAIVEQLLAVYREVSRCAPQ